MGEKPASVSINKSRHHYVASLLDHPTENSPGGLTATPFLSIEMEICHSEEEMRICPETKLEFLGPTEATLRKYYILSWPSSQSLAKTLHSGPVASRFKVPAFIRVKEWTM